MTTLPKSAESSGKMVAGVKQFLTSVAAANSEADVAASIEAGKWLMQVGTDHSYTLKKTQALKLPPSE